MQLAVRSPARRPGGLLRLMLLAGLLLGLAGWQGWQCADGGMAASLIGGHVAHHTHLADDMADTGDYPASSSRDSMLLGACLSVLAAVAGALILLAAPRGTAIFLPAVASAREALHIWVASRTPTLAQLCVLRT